MNWTLVLGVLTLAFAFGGGAGCSGKQSESVPLGRVVCYYPRAGCDVKPVCVVMFARSPMRAVMCGCDGITYEADAPIYPYQFDGLCEWAIDASVKDAQSDR